MDNFKITGLVLEDTARVLLEGVRYSDAASDGSSLIDLLHHSFLTLNLTEFINAIDIVGVGDKTGLVRLTILAHVDGSALDSVVVATGLIDGTGLIGHIIFVHEFESTEGVTTVTTVIFLGARYHYLR